jgi:S-(hydroxymethyl)glutathione dehydrogenase / alcohol dehydrogenase
MVRGAVMHNFMEPLKIESLKLKPLREGEIVVKLAASGVCHSDLSVVQAKLPVPPPVVLGHEGAGIVEEVGKGVTDLKKGDHVVLAWVANCGKCHYCVTNKTHLCELAVQSAMMGQEAVFELGGMDVSRMAGVGSFAEYTIVRATSAIKIREDVPLDRACLVGCGVMTGVGAAINTAKVTPGSSVAVFGCGGVGLSIIQGARLAGAAKIIAVDVADKKLEMARHFGATHTVNGAKESSVMKCKEITGGQGPDFTFEAVGIPQLMVEAHMAGRRGATTTIVGVGKLTEQVPFNALMLSMEGKTIKGSFYGDTNFRSDFPMLLDLYTSGKLNLDDMVSATYSIEDAPRAIQDLEKGVNARGVIVYR